MQSLFAGPPVDLSAPGVLWRGDFRPVSEIPPPVRHASGYELFAAQVAADDEDAAALAVDVRLLAGYLQRHGAQLRAGGEALLDSAGTFLGNALIDRVDDARWHAIGPGRPEVGEGDDGGAMVFEMVRLMADARDGSLPEFDAFLQQWDDWPAEGRARADAARALEVRLVLRSDPVLPPTAFERDHAASLPVLLDRLITYLTTHYRATATWTAPLQGDPHTVSATVRTVRLTPDDPDAAPLVAVVDTVGAVAVRVGALHDLEFFGPSADDLASTLLAVAAGLYREACLPGPDGMTGFRLGTVDGWGETSESFPTASLDPRRVAAAAAVLDALPDGWAPWPLRTATA